MRTMIVAVAAVVLAGAAVAEESAAVAGKPALTAQQLQAIMPKLDAARASSFAKPLGDAMKEFEINTPKRRAAFLAQVASESNELTFLEQLMGNPAADDGRADLGNTVPGDGRKYKGRGPLMVAGRANYKAAGQALKVDLLDKPELMAKPEVGSRAAAWYWKVNGLNELADRGDIRAMTRKVHGDLAYLDARAKFYKQAKAVFGVRD
jgi:putative chitinase